MTDKNTKQVNLSDAIAYFGSGNFSAFTLQSPRYLASSFLEDGKPKERIIRSHNGEEFLLRAIPTTQFDFAVNCAIFRIMKEKQSRGVLNFTISELVKAMNRHDGSKIRRMLVTSLYKHVSSHFDIKFANGVNFHGNRIESVKESKKNHFEIVWNPDYLESCYVSKTSLLDFNVFLSLRPGLQSWLYGFICSANEIRDIDIDTLHTLSGSNYNNQIDFRKAVKNALNNLHQRKIIGWHHGVTRDGLVYWS